MDDLETAEAYRREAEFYKVYTISSAKRKAVHPLTSCKKSARIPLTVMKRSSTREDRPQESLWSGGKRRAGPGEYTAELAPKRPSAQ